ncbi:MAG: hypothetical protein MUO76_15500, partial [Anaerolineaceae bacterium]|nr:hypothetical protein [Anaerolineaceae bacterium]
SAELPAQMAAFKMQQARWARGSLQTARKLMGPLLRSDQPLRVKIMGLIHLTQYMVHPMILIGMLLTLPMSLSHSPIFGWAPLLFAAAIGPPLMYFTAEEPGGPDWTERLKLIPGLILLGIGLSFNNSRAAFAGLLLRRKGTFQRTPKFALKNRSGRWEHSQYALKQDLWTWGEMLLSFYGFFNVAFFSTQGDLGFLPWLIVYAAGFLYVGGVTLTQTARKRSFLRLKQNSANLLRKIQLPNENS